MWWEEGCERRCPVHLNILSGILSGSIQMCSKSQERLCCCQCPTTTKRSQLTPQTSVSYSGVACSGSWQQSGAAALHGWCAVTQGCRWLPSQDPNLHKREDDAWRVLQRLSAASNRKWHITSDHNLLARAGHMALPNMRGGQWRVSPYTREQVNINTNLFHRWPPCHT